MPDLIKDQYKYENGRYSTRFIGSLWSDRSMLAQNSPARQADQIKVPVLLFHGENDRVVSVDQAKKMAKALKKTGKNYKYIELENGDHYRSNYTNRLTYLNESGAFLRNCLN
ncbi:MAG: alpha/beta hydrolase family protein [bacterium]